MKIDILESELSTLCKELETDGWKLEKETAEDELKEQTKHPLPVNPALPKIQKLLKTYKARYGIRYDLFQREMVSHYIRPRYGTANLATDRVIIGIYPNEAQRRCVNMDTIWNSDDLRKASRRTVTLQKQLMKRKKIDHEELKFLLDLTRVFEYPPGGQEWVRLEGLLDEQYEDAMTIVRVLRTICRFGIGVKWPGRGGQRAPLFPLITEALAFPEVVMQRQAYRKLYALLSRTENNMLAVKLEGKTRSDRNSNLRSRRVEICDAVSADVYEWDENHRWSRRAQCDLATHELESLGPLVDNPMEDWKRIYPPDEESKKAFVAKYLQQSKPAGLKGKPSSWDKKISLAQSRKKVR